MLRFTSGSIPRPWLRRSERGRRRLGTNWPVLLASSKTKWKKWCASREPLMACEAGTYVGNGTDRSRTDDLLRVKQAPQLYLIDPPLFWLVYGSQNRRHSAEISQKLVRF